MNDFETFLRAQYPHSTVRRLSATNNLVYLVESDGSRMVAKHLIDSDIPPSHLVETNERLAADLPTQRILRVCRVDEGDEFDAIFTEHVAGSDLATLLSEGACDLRDEALVDYFCRLVLACRRLPSPHQGFGMSKRGAPTFDTHRAYIEYYGKRYWSRVRPHYLGTPVVGAVDAWLDGGLAAAVADHRAEVATVPIDANLKNFVVTPGRDIVLLNLPIVGVSTPAHAVGAVSVHLRHHAVHDRFVADAANRVAPDDFALVPQFEIWQMLGVLSFYAVREPDNRSQWRGFASPVPLYDDFYHLVESHLPGGGDDDRTEGRHGR